ncbi:hypothetical protein M758_11G126600 [Ceratodon purpureus]|nr:hypothetical protein M758_11G126600 [Ceratodon purpureus]
MWLCKNPLSKFYKSPLLQRHEPSQRRYLATTQTVTDVPRNDHEEKLPIEIMNCFKMVCPTISCKKRFTSSTERIKERKCLKFDSMLHSALRTSEMKLAAPSS